MIERDEQEGIAILRMKDGKANVMALEFCERMTALMEELRAAMTPAVVITGAGRIFSAGVDLLRLLDEGAPYIRRFLPALSTMLSSVFSFPKPVVAAINGHAIAGGCVLACAADRRLMARDGGRIGVTELLVGVPFPVSALEIMRCAVPPQHLEDVLWGGATYAPPEASARGLVHEVADPDTLLARALGCAKTLMALPPAAFALTKRQIRGPAFERINADANRAEVEQIWTAPETLARIGDYVRRTLRKA
jgi:enoyl-CoA hydratase